MMREFESILIGPGALPVRTLHPHLPELAPPQPAIAAPALWKLALDKGAAALGLLFFAPFLIGISLIILCVEGGPIFYAHERIGQGGRPFRCLKFRTMAVNADRLLADLLERDPAARREWQDTRKLARDPRISRLGAILRRSSLDELPQFLNVLKGEMSMVGPRPVVTEELHHYGPFLADYLSVRPGLTGLWQVSGRSDTSFEERVALDTRYVRSQSLVADLRILCRTVWVVLRGKGAR